MALRFLNSGYFAGKVGIGTDSPTSGLTISSSAGGDHTWDESGILIQNLSTTTGESAVVFKNSGTGGTGSNYWFTGLNQSNIYRLAYGPNFENGYTFLQLSSLGALTLDAYDSTNNTGTPTYLLGTDASGNVVKTNTVPGSGAGPYLPLSAGSGEILTGDLAMNNNIGIITKDTSGAFRDVLKLNSSNILEIGSSSLNTNTIFKNTGNVGIGTDNPDQILQVEFANSDTSFSGGSGGDWGSEGIRIENTTDTVDTMAMLHLRNNDADIHIAGIRKDSNNSNLGFFFEGTEKVTFTNNGNVGIGTTSPSYTLTTYASTTGSHIVASFGSGLDVNDFTAIGLSGFIASNGATKAGIALKRKGVYGTGELHFLNNTTLDNSDMNLSDSKMMINSSGNVGIGTTSPDFKLDVNGIIRSENSSEVGTLYLGNTAQSQIPGGAIIGQRSPSYSSTGNLLFQVPTWGAGTDYGLTTQMSIEVSTSDTKKATISMIPFGGNVEITNALLSNQSNTNVDTGAEVVAQVSTSTIHSSIL